MTKVRENQPLFIVRLQRGENKPPLSHNAVKVIATERREGASDMLCQSLQCQCIHQICLVDVMVLILSKI